MAIDYSNEPLSFTPSIPVKLSKSPWRDLNTPKAYITIGEKRSGKGVTLDKNLFHCWMAWMTCLYINSAGGFENLYPIVNKNCKTKWDTVTKILTVFREMQVTRINKQKLMESSFLSKETFEKFAGLMASQVRS